MCRSVSKKMFLFCFCYIWVVIGFMMMFTILFSWKRHLSIRNFPAPFVAMLVMMLGEMDYLELQYPQDLRITNWTSGEIEEIPVDPHFPITAHAALLLFILCIVLIIMNLLVGVAVNDVEKLMETGKIDQLMNRVKHAGWINPIVFTYLP